jgi:hypothetical protein
MPTPRTRWSHPILLLVLIVILAATIGHVVSYPARARARRERVREPSAAAAVRLRYVGHGWPAFRAGTAAGAGRA